MGGSQGWEVGLYIQLMFLTQEAGLFFFCHVLCATSNVYQLRNYFSSISQSLSQHAA